MRMKERNKNFRPVIVDCTLRAGYAGRVALEIFEGYCFKVIPKQIAALHEVIALLRN